MFVKIDRVANLMQPQTVTRSDDPRIEPYRAIRERDLVGRRGLFVAEGELVVRMLLRSPAYSTESLLLLDTQAPLLADALVGQAADTPVYVASRIVLDEIAGFPVHRGVLAIGRRRQARSIVEMLANLPANAVVIGLIGIANHDNVGGLFRNAAAFGVNAVFLDATSCDPLYRKAIRVSVGSVLHVPFSRGGTGMEMVDAFLMGGFDVSALSPRGTCSMSRHGWTRRTALLFGTEGAGLPRALLERVRTLAIEMAPGFDSLNVATASGIALHAARQAMKTTDV